MIDSLKPLGEVLQGDERWRYFGQTIESHYAAIADITLAESVPEDVRQQFEIARNTWLYAFFAYRLLQAAILIAHTALELALKEKASREGVRTKLDLYGLLDRAIECRWIADQGFSATKLSANQWEEQREILKLMGAPDCGPFVQATDDQAYAKQLVGSIRRVRNGVAHGEALFVHDISPVFRTIAELINQLFPENSAQS
ncbi:MAG: hypothetical protein HZC22_08185 [Rhodocyclales bacterium]|nr:hypothetical protein [Rhodocyclales bacterium]